MIAHDTREKNARTTRTALAVGPAERKSWAMFEPPVSVMRSGDSLSGCVRDGPVSGRPGKVAWKLQDGQSDGSFRRSRRGSLDELRDGVSAASLPADVLPLSAVKAGMKGYGLTVVRGSAVERFDVEVLGILPNLSGAR